MSKLPYELLKSPTVVAVHTLTSSGSCTNQFALIASFKLWSPTSLSTCDRRRS